MFGIKAMNRFNDAYLEAALWSSTDDDGEPLDDQYSISDIPDEVRAAMTAECESFVAALPEADREELLDMPERAGHDFWLTRNRHGAGFWDGGDWPAELGKRLTEAAHRAGERSLCVGDDGKLYQYPG